MSAFFPYGSPLMTSGAIKYGVPKNVLAKFTWVPKAFEIPKSPSLII